MMPSRGETIVVTPADDPPLAPGGGCATAAFTQSELIQFEKNGRRIPSMKTAPGDGSGSGNAIAVVIPGTPVAPRAAAYSARTGSTPATPMPPITRPPR